MDDVISQKLVFVCNIKIHKFFKSGTVSPGSSTHFLFQTLSYRPAARKGRVEKNLYNSLNISPIWNVIKKKFLTCIQNLFHLNNAQLFTWFILFIYIHLKVIRIYSHLYTNKDRDPIHNMKVYICFIVFSIVLFILLFLDILMFISRINNVSVTVA